MKINVEELSQLERKLSVEIPTEDVTKAFDKVYQTLQRDVTIKGFRKGKAPLATIKSIYKDRVKGDVMNELIQNGYVKALDEKELNPVGYPDIQVATLEEDKPFSFTAKFEIRPDINLKDYVGLEVEKEILEVDAKHVEQVINNIKQSHSSREDVLEDRASVTGDVLVIDFEGFRDGNPVPNTKAEKFELELGSNSFIPGFEDGLTGKKAGAECSLDLKFPETYHAADLAGTPITFKVKVHTLKKKVVPELNDELAKRVGFESVEKLKETLEKDHLSSEEKRINDEFKNRLLRELVKRNPVQVPKSMHQEQKDLLMNDVKDKLAQQGLGEDHFKEYTQKWESDFNDTASFMIQSSFLIHELAAKENLTATEKDFEAKLDEYAKQTGLELNKLRSFYKENENRSRLMYKITEDRVVDFLKSKAKIKEVPKSKLQ